MAMVGWKLSIVLSVAPLCGDEPPGNFVFEEDRREIEKITYKIGDVISFPNANTIIFDSHPQDHQPAHPKPAT